MDVKDLIKELEETHNYEVLSSFYYDNKDLLQDLIDLAVSKTKDKINESSNEIHRTLYSLLEELNTIKYDNQFKKLEEKILLEINQIS
jgi:hypothetical protein